MISALKRNGLKADLYNIVKNPVSFVQVRRSKQTRANQIIQQNFGVTYGSYRMLQYKQKSLILDITANKKLNVIADEAVNADKRRDTVADKKLNSEANKAVDAKKRQDIVAGK